MYHVTKRKSNLTGGILKGGHWTKVATTVINSQSSRAPLGCGERGDACHRCAAHKFAAMVWCYHVSMDQNL